jgi:hypothetical protein
MSKQEYHVEGFMPVQARIVEMDSNVAASAMPEVKLDQTLVDQLVEANEDDDPLFVTLEVMNEGVSKNRKNYTAEFIRDVVAQINLKRPDGYSGHLQASELSTKRPDAQTIWLGAVAKEVDGKTRLFAKAYVLPYAKKLRTYLKSAKVTGKKVAVSISGLADKAVKNAQGSYDLVGFTLNSIDWARPDSEGVPTSGKFVLRTEMKQETPEEGDMDKIEVIKGLGATDLKEHNPQLVTEMQTEAVSHLTAEELSSNALVQEMVANAVTEAKASAEADVQEVVTEMTQVREALGLEEDADVKTAVTEMQMRNLNSELDADLTAKVRNPAARKVIRTMAAPKLSVGVNVTEMVDTVLQTDEAKAIIREMIEKAPEITPRIEKPSGIARKFTKERK